MNVGIRPAPVFHSKLDHGVNDRILKLRYDSLLRENVEVEERGPRPMVRCVGLSRESTRKPSGSSSLKSMTPACGSLKPPVKAALNSVIRETGELWGPRIAVVLIQRRRRWWYHTASYTDYPLCILLAEWRYAREEVDFFAFGLWRCPSASTAYSLSLHVKLDYKRGLVHLKRDTLGHIKSEM